MEFVIDKFHDMFHELLEAVVHYDKLQCEENMHYFSESQL